ncbi:MAG: hypothetical protein ABI972_14560 [Acidobacteriota bacterium]
MPPELAPSMVTGEIVRFLIKKLFHAAPRNLDEELASLIRTSPGTIHSLSLLIHYRGGGAPGQYWIDGAFKERFDKSPGLPTYPMRAKVAFQSPSEPQAIWEWMLAAKAAHNIRVLYLKEYWFASSAEFQGEALMDANLTDALQMLAAPLVSIRAETWQDDRGPGSGINVYASIASNQSQAVDAVMASLYGGLDTPEEQVLIRSWGERTAAAHEVPFRFD